MFLIKYFLKEKYCITAFHHLSYTHHLTFISNQIGLPCMSTKPLLRQLSIDQLQKGKFQPRKNFDQEQLKELAASIQTMGGLLQPIVVRPIVNTNQFEIIAGERRFRAAQLAGLSEVNCLVNDFTDEQALQAAIIENINRSNLNPIEEANAYLQLVEKFNYLHEEVAAAVGQSRTAITNALRLLKLDERVQEFLRHGQLLKSQGKILAGLDTAFQYTLAERAIKKGWSVKKLLQEVEKLSTPISSSIYSDPNVKQLETLLSEHVGNKVNIDYERKGGGYMKIRFNNIDELEGHFERLGFKVES